MTSSEFKPPTLGGIGLLRVRERLARDEPRTDPRFWDSLVAGRFGAFSGTAIELVESTLQVRPAVDAHPAAYLQAHELGRAQGLSGAAFELFIAQRLAQASAAGLAPQHLAAAQAMGFPPPEPGEPVKRTGTVAFVIGPSQSARVEGAYRWGRWDDDLTLCHRSADANDLPVLDVYRLGGAPEAGAAADPAIHDDLVMAARIVLTLAEADSLAPMDAEFLPPGAHEARTRAQALAIARQRIAIDHNPQLYRLHSQALRALGQMGKPVYQT